MISDLSEPMFAGTVIVTVPFPLPLAPDVILTQDAAAEAVHMHPAGAVTITERSPPITGTLIIVVLRANVQVGAAAAWLTENV